jgi:hypothetical protein
MTFSFVKIESTLEKFAFHSAGSGKVLHLGLAVTGTNKATGNRVSRMLSAHTDSGHPVSQCELNEVRMRDQLKAVTAVVVAMENAKL